MSASDDVHDPRSPYPGLRPFEPDEADRFFGRDEQIDELLRRLGHHRFLTIVGTSGCGKSSLVKAGLLPNLRGGGMVAAGSSWRIAMLRPGADPIGNLAAALNAPDVFGVDGPSEEELPPTTFTEPALRRGPLGLVDVTGQARMAPDENLLVLVDQFEEIFRFAPLAAEKGRDDAAAFVKLLLEASGQQDQPIYIVLTMRSDFIGDCARFRGLPEAINAGQYLVPRLTRSQLREAIEGPAAVVGTTVSPILVQALLSEVGDQDRLPLLQHALMRTWTLGAAAGTLDLPGYEATGGMAHALSRHADEAYEELTPREQGIAKQLFQRLTQGRASGRGTRRPSRLSEICDVVEAPLENVVRVIDVFRRPDRSFLMPPPHVPLTPESTIDISHETLMRQWGRLKEWTQQEFESATEYRRLSEAAALHAQARTGLWRRPELDIALAWKAKQRPTAAWASRYNAYFDRTMGFLSMSDRRRWKRVGIAVAVVAAIVVLGGFGAYEAYRRGAESSLRIQRAGSVGDPLARALLLAELAGEAGPDHLRLYRDAAAVAIPMAVLDRPEGEAWLGSIFIDGGRRVARISTDGTVALQSADGRGVPTVRQVSSGGDDPRDDSAGALELLEISATRDGRCLAASSEGTLYVIDVAGAATPTAIPLGDARPTAISLVPDGSKLAAALPDNSLRIWDLDTSGAVTGEQTHAVESRGQNGFTIEALRFDPQGDRLAIDTSQGVQVLQLDGRSPALWLDDATETNDRDATRLASLAFSADGNWLAAGGHSDSVIRIWNSRSPGAPLLLRGHQAPVLAVAFSHAPADGSQLRVVTSAGDASARVWTLRVRADAVAQGADAAAALQTEGAPLLLAGHDGPVTDVAWSADGRLIATTVDVGTTRIWQSEPLEPRVLGRHDDGIESVAFSQDGTLVITSSRDRTARIWKTDGSGVLTVLEGHTDWVTGAAFSPVDPSSMVTASEDQTVRVWTVTSAAAERDKWSLGAGVLAVAFSPDGAHIAAGLADNTANILTLDPAVLPVPLRGHDDWVIDVTFSRDGSALLTAAMDGTAAVWSVSGERRTFAELQSSRRDISVLAAAFSPDGSRVATAAGNAARVWRLPATPTEVAAAETWEVRHSTNINDVAFSREGDALVTASSDQTARLSDTRQGRELLTFEHPASVRAAALDPSGRRVATGAADGVVRLWRSDLTELASALTDSTTACVSPTQRVAYLGESDSRAQTAYEECERRAGRSGSR